MDPKKSLKNTSRGEEEESKGKEWGGLREPIVASERRTVNKKKVRNCSNTNAMAIEMHGRGEMEGG